MGKEVILDKKGNTKSKVIAGKTTNEFTLKAEYFSRGFRHNLMLATQSCSDSDFTAQLLIVEGKLCLHNSFDLYTVNDIFYLHICSFEGHWKKWQEGRVAYLDLLSKSSSCQM